MLELAEQGGPWAWAVLIAGVLMWLPAIALAVLAATGKRVPTAAFLALVFFLVALATVGSGAGLLSVHAEQAAVVVGDWVRVTGRGLELAWIPLVLAGRMAPAVCTACAIGVALGAWLRAEETRFSAPTQAIAPAVFGLLASGLGLAVDLRIALAALGATIALVLVSIREDDQADVRRRLAARRVRVSILGASGVVLALLGAAAASLARADSALALEPWPDALRVAWYAPAAVLSRHAVLPAGFAPVGLVGLAGLAAVLPTAGRLGGWRTWLGGALASTAFAALLVLVGGVVVAHSSAWDRVLPPRTQVAVPHTERVLERRVGERPPVEHRLTWTPRGVHLDGTPLARLTPGEPRTPEGTARGLRRVVATSARSRIDQRLGDGGPTWNLEVPAVTRVRDVRPVLRALLDADPAVTRSGIALVAVGSDGYPGTLAVGLRAQGEGLVLDGDEVRWAAIVAEVERLRRSGQSAVLVVE